jgi:hypothetical protein
MNRETSSVGCLFNGKVVSNSVHGGQNFQVLERPYYLPYLLTTEYVQIPIGLMSVQIRDKVKKAKTGD